MSPFGADVRYTTVSHCLQSTLSRRCDIYAGDLGTARGKQARRPTGTKAQKIIAYTLK